MDNLHAEKMAAQDYRNSLNRWKVLSFGILGALGLGLSGNDSTNISHPELMLTLIPLICIYIDLLHFHDGVVISVIGSFMRLKFPAKSNDSSIFYYYEHFTGAMRIVLGDNRKIRKNTLFFLLLVLSAYILYLATSTFVAYCPAPQFFTGIGFSFSRSWSLLTTEPAFSSLVLGSSIIIVWIAFSISELRSEAPSIYQLEKVATRNSTLVICTLVLCYSFVFALGLQSENPTNASINAIHLCEQKSVLWPFIALSGLFGLGANIWTFDRYKTHRQQVHDFTYLFILGDKASRKDSDGSVIRMGLNEEREKITKKNTRGIKDEQQLVYLRRLEELYDNLKSYENVDTLEKAIASKHMESSIGHESTTDET